MSSRSGSRELFQEVRAPDEDAAELRAWDVVRSVYRER